MNVRLPLSALLSQVLVAFTIEFDNEFEHLVPHRTTNHGSTADPNSSPWLVSMAMWLHFMRFVPEQGIQAKELCRRTGLPADAFRIWLVRLSKWWGYVSTSELFVRPTSGGLKALEAWRGLTGVIEKRWQERYGKQLIDELREIMQSLVPKLGADYPNFLPILGYELLSGGPDPKFRAAHEDRGICRSEHTLPILLSKMLLPIVIEFERNSRLSFAIVQTCFDLPRTKESGPRPSAALGSIQGSNRYGPASR